MATKIILGDCRETLKTLPDDSVQMCFTSPPYWALRSYLPAAHADKHLEIGSEPTLLEWVATMVGVFREVRRVLRLDSRSVGMSIEANDWREAVRWTANIASRPVQDVFDFFRAAAA